MSIFPSKGKKRNIQASLVNKFGLQKLASKEELINSYKTNENVNDNETKNMDNEDININIDEKYPSRKY